MGANEWDIKFHEQQLAAYERAKQQLRDLVEQKRLRAAEAEAEAKLRAADSEQSLEQEKHHYRYPGDAQLIKQGQRMVAAGLTKLAAARKLAPKAKGGSLAQRENRLRKLI
jgi:hypothetical protein